MAYKWYVLQVYANFEEKVAQSIRDTAEKEGVSDFIKDVLVPCEIVKVIKRGKIIEQSQRLHQGYVYINLELNDKVYHFIRKIPRVSGFLSGGKVQSSSKSEPLVVSDVEIARIREMIEDIHTVRDKKTSFDVGEKIQIIDGPFQTFSGFIQEIDIERSKLKLSVSIFNRDTPVELDFQQVKKINQTDVS